MLSLICLCVNREQVDILLNKIIICKLSLNDLLDCVTFAGSFRATDTRSERSPGWGIYKGEVRKENIHIQQPYATQFPPNASICTSNQFQADPQPDYSFED